MNIHEIQNALSKDLKDTEHLCIIFDDEQTCIMAKCSCEDISARLAELFSRKPEMLVATIARIMGEVGEAKQKAIANEIWEDEK